MEDDRRLLEEMSNYFQLENEVYTASTLKEAEELFFRQAFDAVVLDLILPDGNGIDLFRLEAPLPPVIILSDLNAEENVMEGLMQGAADYVGKPCSMRLLEMRISLRLPSGSSVITIEGLTVDTRNRTCKYRGRLIPLTSSEFNILCFLMRNAGEYHTADEIYEKVWNAPSLRTTTIKRHLSALRQKLLEVAKGKTFITTEFGKGYRFNGENT
ncbi:MAG: response regulator transcription factor [Christensenellaceae bacterium]